MKRIISKIDYDMHKLAENDIKNALNLWHRICKNDTIINSAIEVIEDSNGERCFFAPTICHMILSNPYDVDETIYDKLVLSILKDSDLNNLSVFNNLTFLSLIIYNGIYSFDDLYIKLVSKEIITKAAKNNYAIRLVNYDEIKKDDEETISYKSNEFDVTLSSSEMDYLNNRNPFSVVEISSFDEVKKLVEITSLIPGLNDKITSNIQDLYNSALYYQMYQSIVHQEGMPKLKKHL